MTGSIRRVRLMIRATPAIASIALLLVLPRVAAAQSGDCAGLTSLVLPGARIVSAQEHPEYCEVKGSASPVPTSHIGFTVWLPPAARWSQRLHMVGNGGYSSKIYEAQLEAR